MAGKYPDNIHVIAGRFSVNQAWRQLKQCSRSVEQIKLKLRAQVSSFYKVTVI